MLSATASASGTPITYTAPASVPNPATVTLTATSAADAAKSDSATITVSASPPPPPPPGPGTPTLIQHVLGPTAGASVSSYKLQLPNASLAGNCLIASVATNNPGPTITVTDNIGNTYTQAASVAGNQQVKAFIAPGAGAGVTTITFSFSAAVQFVQASASEFNNIATVTPLDGTATGNAFGPTISTSAITTTVAGDLIYQVAWQDTGAGLTTSITQGTSPWKLLHADIASTSIGAAMAQYQVQTTAGAITPSLTINDADHFDSVAIALRSAASGTAMPGGIRIVHLQHSTISGAAASPINTQFPCTGNLIVVAWIGVDQVDLSGVTDGNTNTWAFAGPSFPPGGVSGSGHVRIAYAANATTSTTMTGPNLSFTGTNISGDTALVFDVTGAATAPFDATAGNPTAQGSDSTAGVHSFSNVSITPSTANGLIFAAMGVTSNTVTAVTPGRFVADVSSPEATSGDMDENNGWAIEYNADTATRTYTWTVNAAVQGWAAMAAAFKAAP